MDQTNSNEYSLANDSNDYLNTVIGIGEVGIAVMDDLYKLGVKDLHAVVCTDNLPLLAASPVPAKLLFEAQELESDDLKKQIIDSVLTAQGPVFILVDVQDAVGSRFALRMAECVKEQGLPSVAILAQSGRNPKNTLLQELQGVCHGVLCFDGSDPLSFPYLYRISGTIQTVLKILEDSPRWDDFPEAVQLLKGTHRLAIASIRVNVTENAGQAFDRVIAALRVEGYQGQAIDRVLLLISGYYDHLVTISRQLDWYNQMAELFTIDSEAVKIGYYQDYWPYDSFIITLLIWMPMKGTLYS